jgi:hypothetical protein
MWLLTMMAGLADAPPISRRWVRVLLVAGPLVFVGVGIAGAITAGAFLGYPNGFAKPLIKVIEIALMPSLALTLGLMAGSLAAGGVAAQRHAIQAGAAWWHRPLRSS